MAGLSSLNTQLAGLDMSQFGISNPFQGASGGATNATGLSTNVRQTSIPSNPKDPSATFAAITQREQQRLEQLFHPIEDQVIGSLQDTSIIDSARENATEGFDNLQSRNRRSLRRFGVQLTPVQQKEFERQSNLARSLTFDSAVNEAEVQQRSRNDGLRRELINIGRGVAQEATSSFSDAAALQTQRDARNKQAEADAEARGTQVAATLVMAALLL